MKDLDYALKCQATYWEKNSQMSWFHDGDINSSFFPCSS